MIVDVSEPPVLFTILFTGLAGFGFCRLAVYVGRGIGRLVARRTVEAGSPKAPAVTCGCAVCAARRSVPAIAMAMHSVTTGKAAAAVAEIEFASPEGLGALRLVIVNDCTFERLLKPALAQGGVE